MTKNRYQDVPLFKDIKEILYHSAKEYRDNIAFTIKHKKEGKIEYENKTYQEFLGDVNSFGAALYSLGLKESRVAVMGRNRYEWAVAHLSNLLGGIVSVPLDKELQLGELEESLIRSQAEAIVFDGKYKELLEKIRDRKLTGIKNFICMDDCEEEHEPKTKDNIELEKWSEWNHKGDTDTKKDAYDTFLSMHYLLKEGEKKIEEKEEYISYTVDEKKMSILLFTSGTTSKSKAVMLSQEGIAVNIHDMLKVECFRSDDINIAFLPFHHIFGSTGLLVMLASGIKTVFTDGLRYIKENLLEYKVSVFVGVPVLIDKMYQGIVTAVKKQGKYKMLENGKKLSQFLMKFHVDIRKKLFQPILQELGGNLRLIISGGAPLDKETAKNFSALGVDVVQGYGLTETSPVIAAEDVMHKKPGSIGIPMEHVELEIVNPDENGIGEIRVKGPNVMLGYYENEEATKGVMADGWFYTGDLAYQDKNGYIFITGRKKDMIVLKNGKKVFPDELEFLIGKIPTIQEAFVYGKPDKEDPNDVMVCAKVVYDKNLALQEFGDVSEEKIHDRLWEKIKEINKTLPKYKYIKGLKITEIPLIKTTTNKVKRNEELKLVLAEN